MALSCLTLESKITEDTEWFKNKIEKNEMIDKILISPFLGFTDTDIASYDLHVGEEYESLTTGRRGKIDEKKPLVIKPNETLSILSYEYIGLPQDFTATIQSTLALIRQGLSPISAQIDPGFYGKVVETVTNLSNREITLRYKQPLCKLLFLKLDRGKPEIRYLGDRRGKTALSFFEGLPPRRLLPVILPESIAIIICGLVSISSVALALHFLQVGAAKIALILTWPAICGIIGIPIILYARRQ